MFVKGVGDGGEEYSERMARTSLTTFTQENCAGARAPK